MFLLVLFLVGNVDIWVVRSKWSVRSRHSLWSCHGQIVWGTGLQGVSKWYMVWHWNIRLDRCSLTTRYVYISLLCCHFSQGACERSARLRLKVVRRGEGISRSKIQVDRDTYLIYLMLVVSFYVPWKHQKACFLCFQEISDMKVLLLSSQSAQHMHAEIPQMRSFSRVSHS